MGRRPEAVRDGCWEAGFVRPRPWAIPSGQFTACSLRLSWNQASGSVGSAALCTLLPRIQGEVSSESIRKHLHPSRAIRRSHFMSVESNNEIFFGLYFSMSLCSCHFFPSHSFVLYFTKEMARH